MYYLHTDLCTYLFHRVYLSSGGAYNLQLICAILRKFSNPVKKLLQDLPRKDPFFLHSCKILAISHKISQDLARSCKILQECKKKDLFLEFLARMFLLGRLSYNIQEGYQGRIQDFYNGFPSIKTSGIHLELALISCWQYKFYCPICRSWRYVSVCMVCKATTVCLF